ncbi:MAG TPA: CPBP family intramembrane metalloprotease, partial [Chitinophagaceae bacterium]|nr:CPBP family intramembrane metalloprotease [Chitinophagaceae bacterium]
MLIAFAIGGLILASALSGLVWQQMTGRSFTEMAEGLKNPAYSNVMKIVQTLTAVLGFFVPTVVAAFLLHKRPIKLLGFSGTGINMR